MVHVGGAGQNSGQNTEPVHHDWTRSQAEAFYGLPFPDLIFQAQAFIAAISTQTMSRP
jgi:biotin synthase